MKRILLLAATALLATPAVAHNMWIKPSATTVSGDEGWVTFDAAASTDVFVPDHQPLPPEAFRAYAPDGSEVKLENAMRGRFRSTFDLHLTQVGTWRVALENGGIMGSYTLNGQAYRVGGRPGMRPGAPGAPAAPAGAPIFVPATPDFVAPAGATDVKLLLTANRNEVFVTLGKPSTIALSGKGLEMQPLTHPSDLVADTPARFRFLVDGKPVAGLEVELTPEGRRFRNDQGTLTLKTDARGEIAVRWPGAGLYWIHASYSDDAAPRPGITGRRFGYTSSVEVMAP